jgi:hypothetical protein
MKMMRYRRSSISRRFSKRSPDGAKRNPGLDFLRA